MGSRGDGVYSAGVWNKNWESGAGVYMCDGEVDDNEALWTPYKSWLESNGWSKMESQAFL